MSIYWHAGQALTVKTSVLTSCTLLFPKNEHSCLPEGGVVRRLPAQNIAHDVASRGTMMNATSNPQTAAGQGRSSTAAT